MTDLVAEIETAEAAQDAGESATGDAMMQAGEGGTPLYCQPVLDRIRTSD